MNERLDRIQPGWTLTGTDGTEIGRIEKVAEDHLVVEQGGVGKTVLYVPIDQIGRIDDGRVAALIPVSRVEEAGWRYSPHSGFEHQRPTAPEVPETTMIQAAGMSSGRLSAPEPQGWVRDEPQPADTALPNADVGADEEDPGQVENTGEQLGQTPPDDDVEGRPID